MDEFFDVLNENGEYINEIASRDECHKKGLWHKAVVVFIISNDKKRVLLQQRSKAKKLWPNLWDVTADGHVLSKELGYEAVIRETKEEIGIDLEKENLEFIRSTRSEDKKGDIINRHFNEYYVAYEDIALDKVKLQLEEVQDIKWLSQEEVMERINNNYDGLTEKKGCWEYLLKYFEITNK